MKKDSSNLTEITPSYRVLCAKHHEKLVNLGVLVEKRKFMDSLKPNCDHLTESVPHHLWHGWALQEAFMAGAAYAIENS